MIFSSTAQVSRPTACWFTAACSARSNVSGRTPRPATASWSTASRVTTANTTNLHFRGGRIGDSISPLLLTCPSCSVDQTDGMGLNSGAIRAPIANVGANIAPDSTLTVNNNNGSTVAAGAANDLHLVGAD